VAQVVDSPVDFMHIPVKLPEAVFPNRPVLQRAGTGAIRGLMAAFQTSLTDEWVRCSDCSELTPLFFEPLLPRFVVVFLSLSLHLSKLKKKLKMRPPIPHRPPQIASSQAFHRSGGTFAHSPAVPSLWFISDADTVGPAVDAAVVIDKWRAMGVPCEVAHYEDTRHVQHLRDRPEEYVRLVTELVDRAGLASKRQPEK
jgi:hypothetical protein